MFDTIKQPGLFLAPIIYLLQWTFLWSERGGDLKRMERRTQERQRVSKMEIR